MAAKALPYFGMEPMQVSKASSKGKMDRSDHTVVSHPPARRRDEYRGKRVENTVQTEIWYVLHSFSFFFSSCFDDDLTQVGIAVASRGLRPKLAPEWPHPIKMLMQRAWHNDPKMRPSFAQAREFLLAIPLNK